MADETDAHVQRIVDRAREEEARPCPACGKTKSGGRDLLCGDCWKGLPRILVQLYHYVWKLKQATLIPDDAFGELERLIVLDAGGTLKRRSPLASTVAAAALVSAPGAPLVTAYTKVEVGEPRPVGRRWVSKTSEGASARSRERAVLRILPRLEVNALQTAEVATKIGVHPDTAKRILRELETQQLVRSQARAVGKGRPPIHWWAA